MKTLGKKGKMVDKKAKNHCSKCSLLFLSPPSLQNGPVCAECEVNIHGVCKRIKSCITKASGDHEGLFAVLEQKKQRQEELAAAARTP